MNKCVKQEECESVTMSPMTMTTTEGTTTERNTALTPTMNFDDLVSEATTESGATIGAEQTDVPTATATATTDSSAHPLLPWQTSRLSLIWYKNWLIPWRKFEGVR